LKKLCEFLIFWADLANLGMTKTAEQKLKYATFEGVFFNFSGAKKVLNYFKRYCSVCTKKLHSIKVKKVLEKFGKYFILG
jgi:hypothetical protein